MTDEANEVRVVALLPCPNPWCEAKERDGDYAPGLRVHHFGNYHVSCTSCLIAGPLAPTKAEAIAAWNTRAAIAVPQDVAVDARLLIEESLYHLRLDARAEDYHKRATAFLAAHQQPSPVPVGEVKTLDPVKALTAIKRYFATTSQEQRRKDFASWEPKLMADMEAWEEPGVEVGACDWPAGAIFSFRDEPGEHDPCYVVMPDGAMLSLNHHAGEGVDIARAKFIIAACNAALSGAAS